MCVCVCVCVWLAYHSLHFATDTIDTFVRTALAQGLFRQVAIPAPPPQPNTVNPKNIETERALVVFGAAEHR